MKARIPSRYDRMPDDVKKIMVKEIKDQVLENDRKFESALYSCILYALREEFGFGYGRLKRAWKAIHTRHVELRNYFYLDPEDDGWICSKELEKIGVNVDEWFKEI